MEKFSALLALCAGNSPVTGEFPSQRPVTRNFDVLFDLRLNKPLSKNREAGVLRRHLAHYDVIAVFFWNSMNRSTVKVGFRDFWKGVGHGHIGSFDIAD